LISAKYRARLTVSIATKSLFVIFVFSYSPFAKKNIFFENTLMIYAPVFSNISKTTAATVPIFKLDSYIISTIILSHVWSKSVNAFESYRVDGQTDRRTDGRTDTPSV